MAGPGAKEWVRSLRFGAGVDARKCPVSDPRWSRLRRDCFAAGRAAQLELLCSWGIYPEHHGSWLCSLTVGP